MVKRLCISVSDEDAEFLDLMQLSPSGICKQRIDEIKRDSANYQNKFKLMEEMVIKLQVKVRDYENLLKEHGIIQ